MQVHTIASEAYTKYEADTPLKLNSIASETSYIFEKAIKYLHQITNMVHSNNISRNPPWTQPTKLY